MKEIEIRPVEMDDYTDVYNIIEKNRERLVMYFPKTSRSIKDIETTKKFIKQKIKQAWQKEQFCFVTSMKSSARIIGMIMIKNIDWTIPKAELAYFIDKDFEGMGITSNAVQSVVEFCFERLEMEKLYIKFNPENAASKKVAIKNGFEKEGFLKREFRTGQGQLTDVERYGLLKKQK